MAIFSRKGGSWYRAGLARSLELTFLSGNSWSQGGSVDKVFVGVCPNYIVSTFYWGRVRLVLRSWRLAEYWDVVIWIQHDKAIPQFSLKHQHVLVIVVLPHQAF